MQREAFASVGQQFAAAQQEVDTLNAEDALLSFEREKNTLMFDPDSGYLNSQGKNAMEGYGRQ